jgi:MFS family permease
MYSIDWSTVFARSGRAARTNEEARPRTRRLPLVSGTVWALGVTSLLTDVSSEMVSSILPVYLVLGLGISPLALGVVDGLYQGAAALVRIAGGILADRWRRHKELAAAGYGLSAACRLLILAAGNAWTSIAGVIAIDRIGKGIRTAPRDALISQRSAPEALATAFSVHRSLDAAGAMLGPVLAFAILALMPGSFDVVFVASFAVAILGLGALVLFVPASVPGERQAGRAPISAAAAVRLLGQRRFRGLVFAGFALGLATISDSFVFLILQRKTGIGVTAFPLLYVGTSLFTSAFAIPCGRLADRIGRGQVLLGGYVMLAVVYITLLVPGGIPLMLASVALLGIYYAATDGVLTAMAAAVLPSDRAGSGLAVLATAMNVARLAASIAFGFVWSRTSATTATAGYLVALAAVIVCVSIVLNRSEQHVSSDSGVPPAF